jgi:hypothetical protein
MIARCFDVCWKHCNEQYHEPQAAYRRNCGSAKPAAPQNSSTPVMYTTVSGAGNVFGTIAARSCFILLKCAMPVNTNITASA